MIIKRAIAIFVLVFALAGILGIQMAGFMPNHTVVQALVIVLAADGILAAIIAAIVWALLTLFP